MEEFKVGDRVSHPLHRDGTIEEVESLYPEGRLYLISLGGNRVYRALGHQIKHVAPEPKFEARIGFTTGGIMFSGPMQKASIEEYLTQLPDWDTLESLTISRIKQRGN